MSLKHISIKLRMFGIQDFEILIQVFSIFVNLLNVLPHFVQFEVLLRIKVNVERNTHHRVRNTLSQVFKFLIVDIILEKFMKF
jgi:hypothetical protein